jgi:hypothetical protein
MKFNEMWRKIRGLEENIAEEDHEEDMIPQTLDRVKIRFMVLSATYYRFVLEESNSKDTELAKELHQWVESLAPETEQFELEWHAADLGSWPYKRIRDVSWSSEKLTVLQWALGMLDELSPWDESGRCSDRAYELETCPAPSDWGNDLQLRSPEELERVAREYEVRYWRIRRFQDFQEPEGKEYILKLLSRSAQLGEITLADDGDLLCSDGTSLSTKERDFVHTCGSICMERLQALNWLVGQEELLSESTPDIIVNWLWDEHWE